ncbi:hypothetical protein Hanom_Chr02g00107781 [Helianthus anomalus]
MFVVFTQVEPKLKEKTLSIERQLAEERAARLKAEEDAQATQKKSDEEILYIKEQIEMARRRNAQWKLVAAIKNGVCVILLIKDRILKFWNHIWTGVNVEEE